MHLVKDNEWGENWCGQNSYSSSNGMDDIDSCGCWDCLYAVLEYADKVRRRLEVIGHKPTGEQ